MLSTTTSLCTTHFTGRLTRAATLIVIALWGTSLQAASIFILHSYSQEYNWTKHQHAGFIQTFESQSNQEPTYATEYLDTKRQRYSEGYADEVLRHLSQKYKNYRPDLIYVTDDNALSFARNHLPKLFPNTPVIFSGVNDYSLVDQLDHSKVTGIFEKKEIAPNIAIMRKAGLTENRIVFVGDDSNTYHAIKHEIKSELARFPEIEAAFISAKRLDEVTEQLQGCRCSLVLLTTVGGLKNSSADNFRGVAIFAKVCFGHPSPSKQQKLNATIYAYGAPTVLRTLRNHLFAALHNSLSDSTPT